MASLKPLHLTAYIGHCTYVGSGPFLPSTKGGPTEAVHNLWIHLQIRISQNTKHLDAAAALEAERAKMPKGLIGKSFAEIIYRKAAAASSKDHIALRAWSESKGIEQSMTYEELAKAVQSGAKSLARGGVLCGDRVAFFAKAPWTTG